MKNDNMTNESTREEILKKIAQIFFNNKAIAHIKLLTTSTWYNGRIFIVRDNYLKIHDREDGLKKVYFADLKSIVDFTEKEK